MSRDLWQYLALLLLLGVLIFGTPILIETLGHLARR